MHRRIFLTYMLPTLAGALLAGPIGAEPDLQPEHFVDFFQIQAVELSPDGKRLVALTRRADLESNKMIDQRWLVHTDSDRSPVELDLPAGASSVVWHPDGERLALLAPVDRGRQVHYGVPGSGHFEQVTDAPNGVRNFELGPEGEALAYTTTRTVPDDTPDRNSDRLGVSVDVARFGTLQLLSGRLGQPSGPARQTRLHLLRADADDAQVVAEEYSVTGFAFSPDGNRLALTGSRFHEQGSGQRVQGTDLMVFDSHTDALEVLRRGQAGEDGSMFRGRISHRGLIWSPGGDRLGFLRTDHSKGMAAVSALGIFDFRDRSTAMVTDPERVELLASGIWWQDPGRILIERTDHARRGLYALSLDSGAWSEVRVPDMSNEGFSFSADGQQAAWVAQGTTNPPEIYFGDPAIEGARKLTGFNRTHADRPLNDIEQVNWQSDDGREVHGWLMMPEGASASDPVPLVTMLAGGPSFVVTNRYRLYPRSVWPFPLQIMVDRGYAVLIVHYRGTSSFGPDFRRFTPGRDDVADVHSGVRTVVQRDSIDATRLGIMGHSHGAWLGPMAADGGPEFQAASFAEGMGSFMSVYLGLEGRRNLDLHEPALAATPWEDPKRYLEVSPAFQDQLIENTATLIEAGEEASSFEALQFAKAFWRHGTPHKLVIYPETGHNIRKPAMMVEAMARNLAWFAKHLPADRPWRE